MLPLCACLLASPMKPSCSIEQGGVTQPHSDGNITRPIANILYGKVVKRAPILLPSGSNIGNLYGLASPPQVLLPRSSQSEGGLRWILNIFY